MPTYAMLTTLGPDGWATVRENPERIREVTREVEGMGLKVIAQYALMGQYDFLNVIESPDEATMKYGVHWKVIASTVNERQARKRNS